MIAVILFVFGAIMGSAVNWAIYQLCYFGVRAISPLSPPDPSAPPRKFLDRIPIFGWFGLRRESSLHGTGFWIRPFLIELGLACFTVWFYYWQIGGGLIGGGTPRLGDGEVWFAAHLLLIILLTAATFIDFDEQTIPDMITIPGTIAGIAFAIIFPGMRLPETHLDLTGIIYNPLTFMSPADLIDEAQIPWFENWRGLALGVLVFLAWSLALMPKIATLRYGLFRGMQLMWASMIRPRRQTTCAFRTVERRPFGYVWMLLMVALLLSLTYAVVWYLRGEVYHSLLSSVIGLAFGGGLVWGVRLIAGMALGQEAMGFGDVTLMAMIGSFLGWQATLLVFAFAPFAALLVASAQFFLSREKAIAFGPYLSVACVFLILFWKPIWNDWASQNIFALGPTLLIVIAVSMVMLGLMMFTIRIFKGEPKASQSDEPR